MYQRFKLEDSYQGLPPADPQMLIEWTHNMFSKGYNITGLSFDNEVICHGAIFTIDENRSEFVIAIKPDFQNAGIGTNLSRIIKKASKELGYSQIWLTVEAYNPKARHIYTKLGFKVTSSRIGEESEMVIDLYHDPAIEVTVSKIMTRDVYSVDAEKPASEAIRLFIEKDLSGIPVVNSKHDLVGFISETDVLESWVRERRIAEIMTRDIIFVREKTSIKEIVDLICEARIKQIPVVSEKDKTLIGITSRKDILRYLFDK